MLVQASYRSSSRRSRRDSRRALRRDESTELWKLNPNDLERKLSKVKVKAEELEGKPLVL